MVPICPAVPICPEGFPNAVLLAGEMEANIGVFARVCGTASLSVKTPQDKLAPLIRSLRQN